MNEICLINQVRSHILPYTLQVAKKLVFSVTLFRESFYDHKFSKIKFNLLEILQTYQEHTCAMFVKLQAFISQFKQFHPGRYYHVAYLGGYFGIYT